MLAVDEDQLVIEEKGIIALKIHSSKKTCVLASLPAQNCPKR